MRSRGAPTPKTGHRRGNHRSAVDGPWRQRGAGPVSSSVATRRIVTAFKPAPLRMPRDERRCEPDAAARHAVPRPRGVPADAAGARPRGIYRDRGGDAPRPAQRQPVPRAGAARARQRRISRGLQPDRVLRTAHEHDADGRRDHDRQVLGRRSGLGGLEPGGRPGWRSRSPTPRTIRATRAPTPSFSQARRASSETSSAPTRSRSR